jgi:RNA polymerase sigma-H factor
VRRVTDEQLVTRAKQGDDCAFADLVARYHSRLRFLVRKRYATGLDEADFEQEAIIALWTPVRNFDPSRGIVFSALARIAVTRRLDTATKTALRMKHETLNGALSLDYDSAGDYNDPFHEIVESKHSRDPLEVLVAREDIATVARVLSLELSPLERETAVGMMNGESYADTERRLGVSDLAPNEKAKVVDNAIQRARRKVLAALGEQPRPLGAAA